MSAPVVRPVSQRGVALVMVMGALALIAFVAASFSARIDSLRSQALTLQQHGEDRVQMRSALAATLYWMSTRPLGPAGFGPALAPELRADDRAYALAFGAEVRVQDQRGLYPLNALQREALGAILQSTGLSPQDSDAHLDVLEDYIDGDTLKRLNGAEAPDYDALELPPPRNDWLVSLRELGRMPRWRDDPDRLARLRPWISVGRRAALNPNTAPMALLAARWPMANPDQLILLQTLRASQPFRDGEEAQRATGLPLARDEFHFHLGPEQRVTVSAAGSPRALQYNVTLFPAGRDAPWLITELQPASVVPTAETRDRPERAQPFPLAFPARSAP